ncbi:MAG: 2-hydroxyacyl-CoA dehydratase [Bacillota bacterium]|nr:2-hydroxyacyl-CoA dehydratase [Bacillota bacterium]
MEYAIFDKSMKKDYKILVPTMLPVHFELIVSILKYYGYNAQLLKNEADKDIGLKYVHNDTCYPAQVVISQLIGAIEDGEYDTHKIALLITQTGGGCRASNYISLLRKALYKAGYGYIPVLSLNFSGLDESSLKMNLPMLKRMFFAIMLGDLMMCLSNQIVPYERNVGDCDRCTDELTKEMAKKLTDFLPPSIHSLNKLYKIIIDKYSKVPCNIENKIKVGIVGEIFVKFSPLGNNDLNEFLISQDSEVKVAGLLDFCMYCIYNSIIDTKLYGVKRIKSIVCRTLYNYLLKKQNEMIKIIKRNSNYTPPTPFSRTVKLVDGFINLGVKMGEGWLLTAEILELIDQGVKCIICVQPFGCLPNHIAGKGMIKNIKEHFPDVNIVPIDYDASASMVNQENRIKLMLSDKQSLIS